MAEGITSTDSVGGEPVAHFGAIGKEGPSSLRRAALQKFAVDNKLKIENLHGLSRVDLLKEVEAAMKKGKPVAEPSKQTKKKKTSAKSKAEPKHIGGGMYELADGSRVKGKDAALKASKARDKK